MNNFGINDFFFGWIFEILFIICAKKIIKII